MHSRRVKMLNITLCVHVVESACRSASSSPANSLLKSTGLLFCVIRRNMNVYLPRLHLHTCVHSFKYKARRGRACVSMSSMLGYDRRVELKDNALKR